MRELAIKLRRKQREMRHQQNRRSSEEDSERSGRSRSSSRESQQQDKNRENRSRSKSPSPQKTRIPVWEANREPITLIPNTEFNENHFSQQTKRRHPETSHYKSISRDEDRTQNYRYEKYPNRDYVSRQSFRSEHSQYENKWEPERSYGPGRPRGYGQREGYRGQRHVGPERYGERSSSWSRGRSPAHRDDDYSRSKVKLVDY